MKSIVRASVPGGSYGKVLHLLEAVLDGRSQRRESMVGGKVGGSDRCDEYVHVGRCRKQRVSKDPLPREKSIPNGLGNDSSL